jgi:uncharacterized protein
MLTIEDARTFYRDVEDTTHDFDHVLRVYRLAERIGQEEGADMDVLRTACLLHDIARQDQDAGRIKNHAAEGARRVREVLVDEPTPFVEAVSQAIATHSFRDGNAVPESLEAKILFDADKLDAIGAIGVARAFTFSGSRGRRLWAPLSNDEHTAFTEYHVKLRKIKDRLFTSTAHAIAAERHAFMALFFERLALEVGGEL